ncbi:MAG: hypothetical protein ACRDZN_06460 [Acidimicrobiales bacterium]
MSRRVAVAAAAMLLGLADACGGDDDADGAGGTGTTSDRGATQEFCAKAEEFQQATAAVEGIASAAQMQASLEKLNGVASEAPEAIAGQFDVLIGVLDRLAGVLEQTENDKADASATFAAMQKVLTPAASEDVDDASRDVEAFLRVECGFDTAASEEPATPPTSTGPTDPADLGAVAALNALATKCHDGDMVACDQLYFAAERGTPYEGYGDTCGGRTKVDEFCVDLYPPPDTGVISP